MAEYVTVLDAEALAPGQAARVVVGDEEIALYNVDGEFFATSDICSHEEASLSDGELFDHVVECPLHGARFDVRTGKPLSLPAVYPVKTFPVRVVDGKLQVEI
ncbi:MAG TPA: non-heme iron oxygenase ferredoxin subunit [Chloroflexota bacterium]|jgi:3-phenylpropionate/trans-cinnamate dioxygenase ferredoxin subunit|nr:non-heme iron oxygenase ferredoxin subunit [Chloroflexota bacterium]